MLQTLIAIAGIFLTIFFVVGTHEFGHFITARMLGVKVLRFSIGFGKSLLRWHDKSGTEYVFALIPLGGYVKMLDENETESNIPQSLLPFAYNRQPLYKKFLIVLAGPLTNLICALVLYWIIFMMGFMTIKPITGTIKPGSIAYASGLKSNQQIIRVNNESTSSWMGVVFQFLYKTGEKTQLGIDTKDLKNKQTYHYTLDLTNWRMDDLKPDPLESLGITPYEPEIPLIIGLMQPNSPAADALMIGDKIIAIDNIKLTSWRELVTIVHENPDKKLIFTVLRKNKTIKLPITLSHKRSMFMRISGYLGAAPTYTIPNELLQEVKYPPLGALMHASKEVANFTYLNFFLIGKMITGKLSFQSLGGPITIFSNAGEALNSGLITFLSFLAFLSIAIGVINFLPIPGLDGGHMLIQIVESIMGRPVPERILLVFYKFGLLLILVLLFQSVANDIMRLI